MRASKIEFRLQMMINAVIIILGFWSPWIEMWGIGHRVSLVEWTAVQLGRSGAMPFAIATAATIIVAALFAATSAMFRVWGSAFLGPSTVSNVNMVAGKV